MCDVGSAPMGQRDVEEFRWAKSMLPKVQVPKNDMDSLVTILGFEREILHPVTGATSEMAQRIRFWHSATAFQYHLLRFQLGVKMWFVQSSSHPPQRLHGKSSSAGRSVDWFPGWAEPSPRVWETFELKHQLSSTRLLQSGNIYNILGLVDRSPFSHTKTCPLSENLIQVLCRDFWIYEALAVQFSICVVVSPSWWSDFVLFRIAYDGWPEQKVVSTNTLWESGCAPKPSIKMRLFWTAILISMLDNHRHTVCMFTLLAVFINHHNRLLPTVVMYHRWQDTAHHSAVLSDYCCHLHWHGFIGCIEYSGYCWFLIIINHYH